MWRPILWTLLASWCGYLEAASSSPPPACVTPKGEVGRCVAVNDCPSIVDVIQKLSTEHNVSKLTPQSDQGKELQFVRDSRCKGAHEYSACCAYLDEPTCGEFFENRIIRTSGKISPIDSYPWLALIEYDKNSKSEVMCGGSLISKRHVLTAASCLSGDALATSVRLGEFDTSNDTNATDCVSGSGAQDEMDCTPGALTVRIRRQSVHPEYDAATGGHDLALLTLHNEVPFSDFIKPICLPPAEPDLNDGKGPLRIAGWNVNRGENAPHTLKHHGTATAEPLDFCRLTLDRPALTDGQYCGKARAHGANVADLGGPLMIHGEGWGLNVVGVAGAFRKDLDSKYETDVLVYAKVFDDIHWIRNEMTR